MTRIGIRELRQHASRWVQRAATGERIEVTNRGQLVAALVPADVDGDDLELLRSLGVAQWPTKPLDDPASSVAPVEGVLTAGEALSELREGER